MQRSIFVNFVVVVKLEKQNLSAVNQKQVDEPISCITIILSYNSFLFLL